MTATRPTHPRHRFRRPPRRRRRTSTEHEAGPDSPITYGFKVPKGATQIGPLARFRSAALIAAYKPELDAAIAQREAEDKDKADQAEREGTPLPSEVPKIDTPPSDDTFKPIEDPPKPDTTISLMRIDGKPTDVVRRMLAQISAAIPASDVVHRLTCRSTAPPPTDASRDAIFRSADSPPTSATSRSP